MKKGIDYTGVTVSFCCHDGEGNYFLNKRGTNCRDEHGCWDFGGGGLDVHDTVEETLRKEVREELCADILKFEFIGYRDVHRMQNGIKTHWIALGFHVLVDRAQVKNGEPHKFDEVGWFTLDNLPEPAHSQRQSEVDQVRAHLSKKLN